MKETNNIFERVAERLESKRKLAYKDNPVSLEYFRMSDSIDSKIIGRMYPQVKYIDPKIMHFLKLQELSDNSIIFDRIEIYASSRLTDNISSTGQYNVFILSKRALYIFKKFNLGKHKVYPINLIHKDFVNKYYILHFTNDLQNELDFQKSKFHVSNILCSYQFDISIDNKDDYENKRHLVQNGKYSGTEEYSYINLKYGVFMNGKELQAPDLFTIFSSSDNPYISTRLAQAIIDNELTGFQIDRIYNL